jgi:DNA-binding response OmpR family regulator
VNIVAGRCIRFDHRPNVIGVPGSVLVVEDDALIASSLERALAVNGYDAAVCSTVEAAISRIATSPPDLVLLDLGLPDGDGSTVATYVARHHPTVPVIVLTARSGEIDVVLGLEAGAVDYVVKPFRLAELLARIHSHLRLRDAIADVANFGGASGVIAVADLDVDVAARRVCVRGVEVALRPKEFDVIARLARSAGTVVTREQLIEEVWDENWWGSTKTLDVHINSIRRKLGERAGEPSRITTIRGVGYRLERSPT